MCEAGDAAKATASEPDSTGRVRVVVPIEQTDQAAAEMIRLGVDVEVFEPPELRKRIVAMADEVKQLYQRRR